MNVFVFIFHWVFKNKSTQFPAPTCIFFAAAVTSLLLMFNLGTLEGVIEKLFILELKSFYGEKEVIIFLFTLINLIAFFTWRNDKYIALNNKIEAMEPNKRNRLQLVSLIYVIISILAAVIVPLL